jgi:hypothetical protein
MTSRLLSHARLVMPPILVIHSFIFFYLMAEAVFFLMRLNPRVGRVPPNNGPPTLVLFLAAVLYGVSRVVVFHPVFRDAYRTWLESTPWTSHKPLPHGPIELVWQDGLVIGALILLCATQPVPLAIRLLCVFLLTNICMLILSLTMAGDAAFAYATAFTLGLAVWFWHNSLACVAALAGVYLIAYEGLRRSLARFPWVKPKALHISDGDIRFESGPRREPCGWPYDRMMGEVVEVRTLARIDAILNSILATWWLLVLISLVRDIDDRNFVAAGAFALAMIAAPGIRLYKYLAGYGSPLGLWARLLTFRWIVPGYDQVFVGPLCAVVAGPVTLALLKSYSVPPAICFTAASGAVILVALVTPPDLQRWRLTGQHRLAPITEQKTFGTKPKYIRVR